MKRILLLAGITVWLAVAVAQQNSTVQNHKKYSRKVRKMERDLNSRSGEKVIDTLGEQENETPDLYWVQEYLATMDPALMRPTPEALMPVLQSLNAKKVTGRAMPGTSVTTWQERGPSNVGGRTRAIAWDPTDGTGKKVWAGGVSGGLWYINDITSSSATWTSVSGLWANLAVTAIAFDPNAPGTMYVGTGEGYGSSSSLTRGYGIWKSTDSGKTFTQLGSSTTYYFCTDIVVRDESGTSVVYASINSNYYGGIFIGTGSYGLFRSTNGGSSWTNVSPTAANSVKMAFADLEIGADNRLWAGTMANYVGGADRGGGRVMYSDNGTTWNTAFTNDDKAGRVEVACAPNNSNVVYAIFESGYKLDTVLVTHNKGTNWSAKAEPADADLGISAGDFTRGQAWYDLILAVDPNDSNTLIIGGVDLFRSTNGASSWTQISKWSNNANLNTLSCPFVHSDQHAILYKPGSSSTVIFGCDGGVFYTSSISSASSSSTAIASRNNGYSVTQFYWGDMASTSGSNNMLAGAQDNGTQKFTTSGVNSTTTVTGGDGAYCFISASNSSKQIASYVYNTIYYTTNNWTSNSSLISDGSTGKFINPSEWDDFGQGLFSGKSALNAYRIKLSSTPGTLETITWASSGTDKVSALAAYKNSSTTSKLYVGTDAGRVFVSTDAWAATPSFSNITGTINAGNISGIYALRGSDTVAVVLSNYGVTNIYLTLNGGTSWSAKDGTGGTVLPNMPVWGIVINPDNPNEAVIATEVGVYGTTDFFAANPSWSAYDKGMGSVKVNTLRYRSSDKVLMAVTHGRGVFTSDAWSKTSPIANFGASNKNVCTNQSVKFTDSTLNNPTQWSWKFIPNNVVYLSSTDSSSQNPIVRFTKGGNYTCILTATNTIGNNTDTKSSYITATDTIATSALLATGRDSLCAGDTLSLNVSVPSTLTGAITAYSWFKNTASISGSSASNVVTPAKNDSFYVALASNKFCASPANFKSNKVKPKVIPVVNASLKLSVPQGCSGRPLTIGTTSSGLGTSPSYNWYVNDTLQAAHTSQITFGSPVTGSKVWSTVNVPGFCVKPSNTILSDTGTLVVNVTPATPVVTRNFDTLIASNVGTGLYIWYRNGVSSGIGRVYRAPQNGTYKCVYTDNICASDSSTAIVFNSLSVVGFNQAKYLYPNPAVDYVMLHCPFPSHLYLYNAQGELVCTYVSAENIGPCTTLLRLHKPTGEDLPAGIYILVAGQQAYRIVKQ